MATQQIDIDAIDEVSDITVTTAGTVTNTLRITWDDTKSKQETAEALEKAKLALSKHLSTLT